MYKNNICASILHIAADILKTYVCVAQKVLKCLKMELIRNIL